MPLAYADLTKWWKVVKWQEDSLYVLIQYYNP